MAENEVEQAQKQTKTKRKKIDKSRLAIKIVASILVLAFIIPTVIAVVLR